MSKKNVGVFLQIQMLHLTLAFGMLVHTSNSHAQSPPRPLEIRSPDSEAPSFLNGHYEIKKNGKKLSSKKTHTGRTPATAPEPQSPNIPVATPSVTNTNSDKKNNANEDQSPTEPQILGEEPSLGKQIKSIFSSETEKIMDFYAERIHPNDLRNNRLEFEFRAIQTNLNSTSGYYFRNYSMDFAGFDLGTNIWFTPGVGLHGRLYYSLGADIPNHHSATINSPAKIENQEIGILLRHYFGFSRKSLSTELGISLVDDKLNVKTDDPQRAKIRTNGLSANFRIFVPTSNTFTMTYGGLFAPRLTNSETETGIATSSGSPSETTRLGLSIGSEFRLSLEDQVLIDFSAVSERNLFSGEAGSTDPISGIRPTNVSVRSTILKFMIGYRWGN